MGRGGAKAAVRAVAENLAGNAFVFRTDVKSLGLTPILFYLSSRT